MTTPNAEPTSSAKDFTGQVCLVTGAARGIGYAISQELIALGAKVALVDIEGAAEAAARLGKNAESWTVDVRRRSQVRQCVHDVVEHFGRLDVLVNNAGTAARITLETMDDETWERDIATNLKGTYLFTQAAIYPYMRDQSYGRIVNVSSISGIMGDHSHQARAAAAPDRPMPLRRAGSLHSPNGWPRT